MNDCITLQPCLIAIMTHFTTMHACVYRKVTHSKVFEKKSERLKVVNQIFGKDIQCTTSY